MSYLIIGLVLFVIGNLTHLERVVTRLENELKHIKKRLEEMKNG